MKLVIDINEQYFELLQMAVMNGMGDKVQNIIAQGIPIEQITDEIRQIVDEETKHDETWARGLYYSLCIIDKYTAESEE